MPLVVASFKRLAAGAAWVLGCVAAIGTDFSVLQYNVAGNGATDWSTNAAQVQAIGRQVLYLRPDILSFNEIPNNYVWQMTNFVAAYLPGYFLATNSIGDGAIRNVIASRYPIVFSRSYLHGTSLTPFGYTGTKTFTRDLFQAQITVPGFPQPLDLFVAHLKATTGATAAERQDDANRRAAEASAVSNFFVTVYLPTNSLHPCLLAGDLNEDVFRPETNRYASGGPIQRLVSSPTGLRLTTPLNPYTQSDLTESIRTTLDVRFDYILPCQVLLANLAQGQVFRTDVLPNPPPPVRSADDSTASDHLPVLMVFHDPYARPFRLLSIARAGQTATLRWESVPGQVYALESSSNLAQWTLLASGLVATGSTSAFATNVTEGRNFFRVRAGTN